MIDERITLRKFEIFSVFMGTGNIGRAAQTLQMSPVSVHRALHSLEEGIECPLFVHQGRNLVPLQTAQSLYLNCRSILPDLEGAFDKVRQIGGIDDGLMRLGALYSLSAKTVPRLVMGTKLRRPKLEFELSTGSTEELLKRLLDNRLDAAVVVIDRSKIDTSQFEILSLFDDELFLAAPSSWQSATDAALGIDLKALRNEKFITLFEGFATCRDVAAAFDTAGFEPNVMTRVKDVFSLLSLVQAGMGLALLPGRMCELDRTHLRYFRFAYVYQHRQEIGIVFDRCREYEPNFRSLAAEGRMYAREMASRSHPDA
ncbi:MAG: LysR substrate-binding domain-containing protein [Duodenibacillus sp.]|nr:LysR substrate-binding domain-containing protein [Duodenibacillus sp.]